MVTQEEIDAEAANLVSNQMSANAQAKLLAYFREYVDLSVHDDADVVTKLSEITGEPAQTALAVLTKLDGLGFSTVKVKGGPRGTDYDRSRDRAKLVRWALGYLGLGSVLSSASSAVAATSSSLLTRPVWIGNCWGRWGWGAREKHWWQ